MSIRTQPRECTCKYVGEGCYADNDNEECIHCHVKGFQLEFSDDSLAPMSTCHGCSNPETGHLTWICDNCVVVVCMEEKYPGIPVTVCRKCQDENMWPMEY